MVSRIIDHIFNEVCLDERVTAGIFKIEEEEHMNALRDYFIKRGIPKKDAIHVTNRMVEGKYPDRQAWRVEDGILVTWPSPKHKADAMAKNPGKYTDKDPAPGTSEPPKEKTAPPGSKPEPGEKPAPSGKQGGDEDDEDVPQKKKPTIFQGDKELDVNTPSDEEKPKSPPTPPIAPTLPPAQKTPERMAAEKEIVKQIMNTDDTILSNVANPINETCRRQLNELYKKADEMGFREAVTFLTPYVKP